MIMNLKTKVDGHILNQQFGLIPNYTTDVKSTIARAFSVIASPLDLKRVFVDNEGLDFLM